MRRRDFITGLAGAPAWPLAARAQQPGKMPTVAILGTATPSSWKGWIAAFEQRLRELGWVEGRTVAFAYRWSEGNNARLPEFAAEFARLKPDVILTTGTAVPALRQAISDIPIVFADREKCDVGYWYNVDISKQRSDVSFRGLKWTSPRLPLMTQTREIPVLWVASPREPGPCAGHQDVCYWPR